MSELERKNVWDFYSGTLYNRLQPGGAIVTIGHRMHQDDLCGRLLEQQAAGGDKWEVVELPAINEAGEALWPEAYDLEALERIRRNTFPRDWSALYLQNPVVENGDYFQREWLKPVAQLPDRATMKTYVGCDFAVTSGGGDFSVICVVGLDPEGRMFLVDLWRKQASSDVWVETLCDMIMRWKPQAIAQETGQIRSGIGPFLTRRMRERGSYAYMEVFPTKHDKAIRAQSIRARMALDGLHYSVNAPWFPTLQSELLAFPNGKHDDIVDALGLIGQLLDLMSNGRAPSNEEKKPDELAYIIRPDGSVRSNMSVFDIVQAKLRRKARD